MAKHDKTRQAIRTNPVLSTIRWDRVVAFLESIDVEVIPTGGSAYSLERGEQSIVVHRPHPGNECPQSLIRSLRVFLDVIGD